MKIVTAFATGALFAIGLVVSGMTQPSKVIGFLDVFGDWDPSLAFVVGGAVGVNALFYRLAVKKERPLFHTMFHLPTRSEIDWRLVAGGALFGVGWGLVGYCPGPALTSIASLQWPAVIFVAAMAAGMLAHSLFDKTLRSRGDDVPNS